MSARIIKKRSERFTTTHRSLTARSKYVAVARHLAVAIAVGFSAKGGSFPNVPRFSSLLNYLELCETDHSIRLNILNDTITKQDEES